MAAINLDRFKRLPAQSVKGDRTPTISQEDTYIFKDIDLDFEFGNIQGNAPANKNSDTSDIKDLKNMEAIKASIRNIFNTSPGQKLLNPHFGLNLSKFAFEPMTPPTADLISRTILMGLPEMEPRFEVINLSVVGIKSEGIYEITMMLTIKDKRIHNIQFNGSLSPGGFKFER